MFGEGGVYVRALGNAPLIGRAAVLVDVPQECTFVLDCGVQEKGAPGPALDRDFSHDGRAVNPLRDAHFMFISHAHQDHAGAARQIAEFARRAPVYATPATRELMQSANHELRGLITPVPFYTEVRPVPGAEAYFILTPAGHLPGSAIFTLRARRLTLVYTGDYLLSPSYALSGAQFPREARGADVLVAEVTFAQFVFRQPVFADLLHFQHVLQLALAGVPAVHPASSFGTAQELAARLAQYLSRCFLGGGVRAELVQGAQQEVFSQAVKACEPCEVNCRARGFYNRDVFAPYRQFRQGARQLVVTCPQRLSGGVTIDLLFEPLARGAGLLCFCGNCQPGTQNWRFMHGVVREIRRDNMRAGVPMGWECSQLQYQSHADLVQLVKLVDYLKPRCVCMTHTSDVRNLELVRDCLALVAPAARCGVLGQAAFVFRPGRGAPPRRGALLRIRHGATLRRVAARLEAAGLLCDRAGPWLACGPDLLVTDRYVLLRRAGPPHAYAPLLRLLGAPGAV